MEKVLNILMLEDAPFDVDMVQGELQKGELQFSLTRVDEEEGFFNALKYAQPDLIFSDHGIPPFDGFSALAMARDCCPEVPFIFVTGSLGEEMTIKAFESGATDCVLKNRLSNLVPAVKRALRQADENRRLKAAEGEVRRLTAELKTLRDQVQAFDQLLTVCSGCKRVRDESKQWHQMEVYLNKRLGLCFSHGVCPECIQKYFTGYL
jgi:CheY-like chemotaxis protein